MMRSLKGTFVAGAALAAAFGLLGATVAVAELEAGTIYKIGWASDMSNYLSFVDEPLAKGMQVALDETRAQSQPALKAPRPPKPVGVLPHIETGVDRAVLDRVFQHLTEYPESFTVHPKLAKQFQARAKLYEEGEVEWATAESLAFGSLLYDGHSVRLAGEDSRRGTFSQRHVALVDYETGKPWIPLDDLTGAEGRFWVYDSLLSEYAALGFE